MRHIQFATLRDLERPTVRRYIETAIEQAAPPATRHGQERNQEQGLISLTALSALADARASLLS